MQRETAQFLVPFVNKVDNMDSIKFYAEYRIQTLQKELENADLSVITGLQGQIKELRKLSELDILVKSKVS